MANKKRQATPAGGRVDAAQTMGLEHGSPSLVAQDSPDDPQTGAPSGQARRNRAKTPSGEGDR